MKKIIIAILTLSMIFALVAACGTPEPPAPADDPVPPVETPVEPAPDPDDVDDPVEPEDSPEVEEVASFPGRIAIITNEVSQNEEEFRSAAALVYRYGADKVIHRTWPVAFAAEGEMMISIMMEIASDPEVGAIIINQAVINTNAAIDAVRELRGDDIFIGVVNAAEDPADVSLRVDLALNTDDPAVGYLLPMQAYEMGATAIGHISFPRHMAVPHLAARRDIMRETAENLGLEFHEIDSYDPMGDGGVPGAQLYITQNIANWVQQYGQDTVFFSTNCAQQIPLMQGVLENGAMMAQPCCPSPFHGFPAALGLSSTVPSGEYDADGEPIMMFVSIGDIIRLTSEAVAAAGMEGRMANWALPAGITWTNVAFYYAAGWLNGDAWRAVGEPPDMALVHRLVGDFMERETGTRYYMNLANLEVGGEVFPTFVVGVAPYIVY